MSELLNPLNFGLPNIRKVRFKHPRICRKCDDEFTYYRWGGSNYCPDCDIKRMHRINEGMNEIANKFGLG